MPSEKVTPLRVSSTEVRKLFKDTCEFGFSVLDRHRDPQEFANNPWMFGSGFPPSYAAQGRFRLVTTLERVTSVDAQSVLEVAAGGAFLSACLAGLACRVAANDLRHFDVDVWKGGERIERVIGDVFSLDPARLGTFDLVLACEVIEHIAHGPDFVRHLARFLNPGGTLFLTTPNGSYWRSRLPTFSQVDDFQSLESRQFQPDADGHLYLYTPREMHGVLASAGLKDIQVTVSTSPFIAGHLMFRYLPKRKWLTDAYWALDSLISKVPRLAEGVCVHLVASARAPE